jgi:hypothetical protein
MSLELAEVVPRAGLKIPPGEGHYSLPVRHVGEALALLNNSF